jgi:hypothetical protein
MISVDSPFAAKRYEYSGNHIYYIPPAAFRMLESPIPTFLVGTRGTGKTTLLKALSWDERLYNSWLKRKLGASAFEKRYIGLYFKLPNAQLSLLDRWLDSETDADYAAAYGFYLDLCWLETLMPAIRHLAARKVTDVTRRGEAQFLSELREIWQTYPACQDMFGPIGSNINEVLALMHPMRRAVENFARQRVPLSDVLEALPIGQIGSFGRRVGKSLMTALDEGANPGSNAKWSLRVCLDEGESLSLRQQRVINSMVRLTEWPVFYLVAYVSRPQDATGTFLPKQTLQLADRQILVRDDMSDREFKDLAEGVVNVRLQASGVTTPLRTRQLLGSLDIDALLERILKSSEDPQMRTLLEVAGQDSTAEDGSPPIYETYLRIKRPELGAESSNRRARRHQSSASIRKQMVAAYLSICREAGATPLYASSDMLLQVSDKCIRDFLWQLESIYSNVNRPLSEFLSSTVDVQRQSDGMHAAAELKMTLFRERVISAPTEANQLVEGLARVTALIQSTGRNYEQLRTPERGIFTYAAAVGSKPGLTIQNESLIRDAAEAGFLKLLGDGATDELKFRVHASLSPHYHFSYRGAYYAACELNDVDIVTFRLAKTSKEMDIAVARLVQRITGRRPAGRNRSAPIGTNQPELTGIEVEK